MISAAWSSSLRRDLGFAVRQARRAPALATVALLTFALGIGATTAVYSVVHGVMLRPLPFEQPSRLAALWPTRTISNAELDFLQGNAHTLSAVAAFSPGWGIPLTGAGEPRQLDAARVSANFFQTLGVRPALGRAFLPDEQRPGRWDVAVISQALWRSQFASDPAVIGRVVTMDGTPTRIVGVMPGGFDAFQHDVDAWLPLMVDPASPYYTGQTALALGRLAPGASLAAATAELRDLAPRMRDAFGYAEDYAQGARVIGLHESMVGNVRLTLLVLLGAVALVLAIAIANIANLMLVRATGRQRELAIRRALGASPRRVAGQLLIESLLLAAAGGAAGVAAAAAMVRGLRGLLPSSLPQLGAVRLDAPVLAATLVLTLVAGVAFATGPSILAWGMDPERALRASASERTGAGGGRTRRVLVVAELAFASMLVVGAGLMVETMWRLGTVDLGFDPRGLVSFRLQPTGERAGSAEATAAYFEQLLARLGDIRGVTAVGASQHLPLTGFNWHGALEIEGRPLPANAERPDLIWRSISGDYLAAMRIPLLRGRAFDARDTRDAPAVVIVSESMARRFWPDGDPIGQRIRFGNGSRRDWATIVGVVGAVRSLGPDAPPVDEVYRPHAQQAQTSMHIVVRGGRLATLMPEVRRVVRAFDADVPIAEVRSLEEIHGAATAGRRAIALLLGGFAATGLLLGAVGVYGVMSYAVSRRGHELAIRPALGSGRRRLLLMVVREGLRLSAAGIGLGIAAALVGVRALRSLVFEVSLTDPVLYGAVIVVLGAAALVASLIPAARAARTDPMQALRAG